MSYHELRVTPPPKREQGEIQPRNCEVDVSQAIHYLLLDETTYVTQDFHLKGLEIDFKEQLKYQTYFQSQRDDEYLGDNEKVFQLINQLEEQSQSVALLEEIMYILYNFNSYECKCRHKDWEGPIENWIFQLEKKYIRYESQFVEYFRKFEEDFEKCNDINEEIQLLQNYLAYLQKKYLSNISYQFTCQDLDSNEIPLRYQYLKTILCQIQWG